MSPTINKPTIEGLPSNPEIVSNLADLEKRLNTLEPLVNKAQTAFGGMSEVQTSITDLRNRIAKAKATYQA